MPGLEETKQCPICGETIKAVAVKCRFCGQYLDGRPPESPSDDFALKMLLPVGRSGWAIAAGYLGLLSCFPFVGLLFGLAALWTGLKARQEIRANPKLGGSGRAMFGIILGSICALGNAILVVGLIVGLLQGKH